MLRHPSTCTLFPYTTLFRSYIVVKHRCAIETWSSIPLGFNPGVTTNYDFTIAASQAYGSNVVELEHGKWAAYSGDLNHDRSEEHTSELQSPDHLVCRLLLEK